MLTKLDIFDFDGTLYRSPTNTKENHDLYEKATGIPWMIDKEMSTRLTRQKGKFIPMRRGWFGKIETLQPPLVPSPAPDWWNKDVVEAFNKSLENPESITLILTGRHVGLKHAVLRICKEGKLFKLQSKHAKGGEDYYENMDERVTFLFMGNNGPIPNKSNKPNETISWKLWIIEQYLELNKDIKQIEVWEDREEHIGHFQDLEINMASGPYTVIVNHIKADSEDSSDDQ